MATLSDISTAIVAALTEIGVTGEVDVTMGQQRSVKWIGQPSGDDVLVSVDVLALPNADRAQPSA